MSVSPWLGPMLGGQLLTIGGPCMDTDDEITINYGNNADALYACERLNEFAASCVTPMFNITGKIPITVYINRSSSQNTDNYTGQYHVGKFYVKFLQTH